MNIIRGLVTCCLDCEREELVQKKKTINESIKY